MREYREEEDAFEIPMTSLIDVVFLLLIFFLVATNFRPRERMHHVDLPKAGGGEVRLPDADDLVLHVDRDGVIQIAGEAFDAADLPPVLRAWREAHPERRVSIRGDEEVPYLRIMQVMGLCRQAGIRDVDLPVGYLGETP